MGQFLSMSGVIGAKRCQVEEALRRFAESRSGYFGEEPLDINDDTCLIIAPGESGVTVLYPGEFFDWDAASAALSLDLNRPVFSLHIHDSDLWTYVLFVDGEPIDQFNPLPEYWGELSEEEFVAWRGSAAIVAKHVPGLAAEDITRYFADWNPILDHDKREKAYPDDEFCYGDDWQLCDFMRRVGLTFPIDERGNRLGETYRFECPSEGA